MKTYAIKTLGCKVDQYEGQLIGELSESRGFSSASSQKSRDLVIVSTCIVTGEADRTENHGMKLENYTDRTQRQTLL